MGQASRPVLLELLFRTLHPVDNLPLCHCVAWNGYLRNALRPHLPRFVKLESGSQKLDMKAAGIRSVPVENGVRYYPAGAFIPVAFNFDPEKVQADLLQDAFNSMQRWDEETSAGPNGKEDWDGGMRQHFSGHSVSLVSATCRICGKPWDRSHECRLDHAVVEKEAWAIRGRRIKVTFRTPLIRPVRQNTESTHKGSSQAFVDPDWIHSEEGRSGFCKAVWGIDPGEGAGILAEQCGVLWHKLEYARQEQRKYMSFNGILGSVRFDAGVDQEFLEQLVAQRHSGVGNNLALGFGAYEIETEDVTCDSPAWWMIPPLQRRNTLFSLTLDLKTLRTFATSIPDCLGIHSGGKPEDLAHAPDDWYQKLLAGMDSGDLGERTLFTCIKRKTNGIRVLCIQDPVGQLLQKCLSHALSSSFESEKSPLFRDCCHSYRKGKDYRSAIKDVDSAMKSVPLNGYRLDIASFFDSVSRRMVMDMIQGLLWGDTTVTRIGEWSDFFDAKGISGLPQGSPLSPLLSNLVLTPLDTALERAISAEAALPSGYVRYADDLVVWSSTVDRAAQLAALCRHQCAILGFRLRDDKTLRINPLQAFEYLGHVITRDAPPAHVERKKDDWDDFHCAPYAKGVVVYVTGLVKSLSVDRDSMRIGFKATVESPEPRETRRYAWKDVSRIVMLSGGIGSSRVFEQAMRHDIPVAFIDHRGELSGMFLPESSLDSTLPGKQAIKFSDHAFCLEAAKELVRMKIDRTMESLKLWSDSDATWNLVREQAVKRLNMRREEALVAKSRDSLLGYEGTAAKEYFECFAMLCKPFAFTGRHYRPPKGEINALLSLGYTLLYARVAAAVKARGLMPHMGILHQPHGTHMVLASDLMEPLRFMVDRMVVDMVKRKVILPDSFRHPHQEYPEYALLDWPARNSVLRGFEQAFEEKTYFIASHDPKSCSWILEELISCLLASIRLNVPFRGPGP